MVVVDATGEGDSAAGERTRVVGDSVDLDYSDTQAFFERRADRAAGVPSLTVTMYQDQRPHLAAERDRFEYDRVVGRLRLDRRPNVLDIGCGIGRWGTHLAGRISSYVGTDFSAGLVDLARANLSELSDHLDWQVLCIAATDVDPDTLPGGVPFGVVIISGLLIYLNDDDVCSLLAMTGEMLASDGVLYVREPVAVQKRLTLSRHYSEELQADYNAIYRPVSFYRDLIDMSVAVPSGALTLDESLRPELANRAETVQHLFVYDRSGA